MLEEALPPHVRPPGSRGGVPPRRLLELLLPGGGAQVLRLADPSPTVPDTLLKVDEQGVSGRGGGLHEGGVCTRVGFARGWSFHWTRGLARGQTSHEQGHAQGQASHEVTLCTWQHLARGYPSHEALA